mmetsp:Transcript_742/g.1646  ORF Transcript_742/g.1646 Transcript_742/m.1646 type:complete len:271 (+) Transcript_742:624-1436(+)
MSLDSDNLSSLSLHLGAIACGLLVLLNGSLVHHSSGSNGNVIILGEHPSVEIWRHIISDIHLSQILVVLHLLIIDANTLLESNSIICFSSTNVLCNTRVCSISSNDHVNLQCGWHSHLASLLILVIVQGDWAISFLLHAHVQTIDQVGSQLFGALTKVVIEHLSAAHTNPLLLVQSLSNINLTVGWRNHLHLCHATINNLHWQVKLFDHTDWNSSSTWLAVVHFTLKKERFNSPLGQSLRSACSRWSSANHSHSQRPIQHSPIGNCKHLL